MSLETQSERFLREMKEREALQRRRDARAESPKQYAEFYGVVRLIDGSRPRRCTGARVGMGTTYGT